MNTRLVLSLRSFSSSSTSSSQSSRSYYRNFLTRSRFSGPDKVCVSSSCPKRSGFFCNSSFGYPGEPCSSRRTGSGSRTSSCICVPRPPTVLVSGKVVETDSEGDRDGPTRSDRSSDLSIERRPDPLKLQEILSLNRSDGVGPRGEGLGRSEPKTKKGHRVQRLVWS